MPQTETLQRKYGLLNLIGTLSGRWGLLDKTNYSISKALFAGVQFSFW